MSSHCHCHFIPLCLCLQPLFLLQLVAVKLLATAVCRGSRLVGGFYAPSLFVGAALGAAYGQLANAALMSLPGVDIPVAAPQAYAMVRPTGGVTLHCNGLECR